MVVWCGLWTVVRLSCDCLAPRTCSTPLVCCHQYCVELWNILANCFLRESLMCNIPTVSQQVGNLEEKCIFQNSLIRWERTVSWSNHSTVPMALQYHAQTHCEYQVAVSEQQPGRRRQHDNKSPGDLRRLQIFPSYFTLSLGAPRLAD